MLMKIINIWQTFNIFKNIWPMFAGIESGLSTFGESVCVGNRNSCLANSHFQPENEACAHKV